VFMERDKANNVKTSWYIDFGCITYHFTNKRDWYINYVTNESSNHCVVLGGGEQCRVEGKGKVQITLSSKMLIFLNVHYVSVMDKNLLSIIVIMMNNHHLHMIFGHHKCYFVDKVNEKTLAHGIEEHGMFMLVDAKEAKEYALMVKSAQYSSDIWHQRFGHLNLRSLSYLAEGSLLNGLPNIQYQQGICGACQAGRQHRTPFEEGQAWRAKEFLQSMLTFVGL
jgi:hypothetical protein